MTRRTIKFFGKGEIGGYPDADNMHHLLLLLLALGPEKGRERKELANIIWEGKKTKSKRTGEEVPVKVLTNLTRYLSQLRTKGGLEDFLTPGKKGSFEVKPVWLKTADLDIDVLNFDAYINGTLEDREKAIPLYRGRLLAKIENSDHDREAVKQEREKRHSSYLSAIKQVSEHKFGTGHAGAGVDLLIRRIELFDTPELYYTLAQLLEQWEYNSCALAVAEKYIELRKRNTLPDEMDLVRSLVLSKQK